jgi:Ca-activated chloride channel homolog
MPSSRGLCHLVLFASVIWVQSSPAQTGATSAQMLLPTPGVSLDFPAVPTITKDVNEVQLAFTAVDHHGKFVTDLADTDLNLLDDKNPPSKVAFFHRQQELPVRVAVVVDVSASVAHVFRTEQRSAVDFLAKVIRPDKDQATVIAFNSQPTVVQDFTSDANALAAAVHELKSTPGATAIYDAVRFACNRLQKGTSNELWRKAIVLITDGEENSSRAHMADAVAAAQQANVVVFAIYVNTTPSWNSPSGAQVLRQISEPTGGRKLLAGWRGQLASAFAKIEEELRSQYVIGYIPAAWKSDGHFRHIQLKSARRGIHLHYRPGYYELAGSRPLIDQP